ncbi:MAG TPA: glycosyltransferase, partial [Candidatus Marinimicrobia bacterium]|nr:glycosyltransferase [Candidatus Neomarinimicrobiota bacterium]
MNPKVSVLIVSYNVKEYVDHAIDSIMRSSVDDYEIILVDNNSFDGTVEYIKHSYPDVNVIANQENFGFGKAVNQAADVASGQYF